MGSHAITDRDLAIIYTIERYRFIPTSLLVRLLHGNERVTQRRLQILYHRGLVNRFTLGRVGGEFIYFLDSRESLRLLADATNIPEDHFDWEVIDNNRERYSKASADLSPGAGSTLFLRHELLVSRFHALLELGCRSSNGQVALTDWRQGPALWNQMVAPKASYDERHEYWYEADEVERLAHRPDAFFSLNFRNGPAVEEALHFFYELDRGTTTNLSVMRRKLRAHFQFIKQRKQREYYGIDRVRAVLIETRDSLWQDRFLKESRHPMVSGRQPSGLFWVTHSKHFTNPQEIELYKRKRIVPLYLLNPKIIFDRVWATPVNEELWSLRDA